MPAISVIIPVYDGEKTIQATIESVLSQTLNNFELIIINSSSTDSTLDIIGQIKDPRLLVFTYPQANVAVNRNRGITHATGEFISFLDADDLWTPDKLEAQLVALQEHPEAAVAYSWTHYIDESGQFLHPGRCVKVTGNTYRHLLISNILENGSNSLISRQALSVVGDFDESLPAAQDWDISIRLAMHYKFVLVPHPQILYRVSTNSMSANLPRIEAASLQVIERAFKQAPVNLQHLKKYSLSYLYKYLTFRAIDASIGKQRTWKAAHFLWQCVKYDIAVLRQTRLMLVAVVKITVVALLPPQQAQALLSMMRDKGRK